MQPNTHRRFRPEVIQVHTELVEDIYDASFIIELEASVSFDTDEAEVTEWFIDGRRQPLLALDEQMGQAFIRLAEDER